MLDVARGLDWPEHIHRLHEALLTASSATAVIEALFGEPVRVCKLSESWVEGADQKLLETDAPIRHRRVTLLARGLAVSQADLWYVPSRLGHALAETLATTDEPFGHVVRHLAPVRDCLGWRAEDGRFALSHRARLRVGTMPVALVHERYFRQPEVPA